jgi:cytochrome c oxidase subunit 2
MWNWSITYPNGAASTVTTRSRHMGPGTGDEKLMSVQETPVYVVPEEFPVNLRMHSEDVIHSFWIPDFRVKFDVFPNRYTTLWFQAKKMDPEKVKTYQPNPDPKKKEFAYQYEDHWVFCAEYCGQLHSDMYAVIRVVSLDDFQKLMTLWAEPTGEPWEKGQAYYKIKGCNSCHSVDGSRNVGPTWKNMWGHAVELSDGRTITVDADYVRESILTPAAKIVKGYPNQMQSFQGQLGKDNEILEFLIAYMQHLSDKGPPPLPGAEAAPAQGGGDQPPHTGGQQPPAGTQGAQQPAGPGGTPVPPGSPK